MTRVLHLDTSVEWRGGQRQLELLLRGRPGDVWAGVPDSPLAVRVGPPAVTLRAGQHPLNLWTLRREVASLGVDLVAAHTAPALAVGVLAGLRPVAHRRVDFVPSAWKYRRASHVIAVSEAVRRVMLGVGVPPERVDVVHDGVPPVAAHADARWLALPGPRYGCVGALVAHKGHRVIVDAMTRIPGTLVIAGEGPLRGALARQIAALGLEGRVHLVGALDGVGGLLGAIDVFVHPSLEEGMGQAVIEAMGAGCRVVASTAGGVPEAVGDAGLLVPVGDAAALAGAMVAALAEPRGRGVERAASLSDTAMAEATGAVYERVAMRVSPPSRRTGQ